MSISLMNQAALPLLLEQTALGPKGAVKRPPPAPENRPGLVRLTSA